MNTLVSQPYRGFGPIQDADISPLITRVKSKTVWAVTVVGENHATLKLGKHRWCLARMVPATAVPSGVRSGPLLALACQPSFSEETQESARDAVQGEEESGRGVKAGC